MLTCIPEAFKICHQIHDLPSTAHSARVCVKGCPLSLEHAIYITCVQRSLRPGPLADELLHDELPMAVVERVLQRRVGLHCRKQVFHGLALPLARGRRFGARSKHGFVFRVGVVSGCSTQKTRRALPSREQQKMELPSFLWRTR